MYFVSERSVAYQKRAPARKLCDDMDKHERDMQIRYYWRKLDISQILGPGTLSDS
jgi:hypothetical protein